MTGGTWVRRAPPLEYLCVVFMVAAALAVLMWGATIGNWWYADAPNFFIDVVKSQGFFIWDKPRIAATFLQKLPLVLALRMGLRDLNTLYSIYIGTLVLIPAIGLLMAFVLASKPDERRWRWLALLSWTIVTLSGAPNAVSEHHVATAIFWPTLIIAQKRNPTRGQMFLGLGLMALLLLTYQSTIFMIPIIVVAAIRNLREQPIRSGQRFWVGAIATLAALGLIAAGVTIVFPFVPGQRESLVTGLPYAGLREWFCLGALVAFLATGRRLVRGPLIVMCAAGMLIPLSEGSHYASEKANIFRGVAAVLPAFLALYGLLAAGIRRRDPLSDERFSAYGIAIFLAVQTVALAAINWDFARFQNQFREVLAARAGVVAIEQSGLPVAWRVGTHSPDFTLLLTPGHTKRIRTFIANPADCVWQPHSPRSLLDAQDALRPFGITFDITIPEGAGECQPRVRPQAVWFPGPIQ